MIGLLLLRDVPETFGGLVEHQVDDAEVPEDPEEYAGEAELVPHARGVQREEKVYYVCYRNDG